VSTPERLSTDQARRIALAAQGFSGRKPRPPATVGGLDRALDHTHLLQIDSVNVLSRAHYLPLYSRLGPYRRTLLDRAAGNADAEGAHPRGPVRLFEYWAHEASLLPVRLHPLMRFRMARMAGDPWGGYARVEKERPGLIERVLEEIADRGPITARQLTPEGKPDRVHWGWNWSNVKVAAECLFHTGRVSSAGRTTSFERRYALPEQVLPAEILAAPTPAEPDAVRSLVDLSAQAHGIATEPCLRDYFRLRPAETATAVTELVRAGRLVPAQVEGWRRKAYLHADAVLPARCRPTTLLNPFDPLVFNRFRAQTLFGFDYRIEIYVPAPKRVHGYYVLPFLLDGHLVARVDLKADRKTGVLLVQSAHAEPSAPGHTASALAAELQRLAGWLGLGAVAAPAAGDLAPALAVALS
jgi:uncharacterized protein